MGLNNVIFTLSTGFTLASINKFFYECGFTNRSVLPHTIQYKTCNVTRDAIFYKELNA